MASSHPSGVSEELQQRQTMSIQYAVPSHQLRLACDCHLMVVRETRLDELLSTLVRQRLAETVPLLTLRGPSQGWVARSSSSMTTLVEALLTGLALWETSPLENGTGN